MFVDPYVVATVVLSVLVAGLLAATVVRWILSLDAKVDERQETYSKLAGLMEMIHLHKLADIGHSFAALSIRKAVQKIRALVDSLGSKDEVLLALTENFEWQTGERLTRPQDRSKLIKAVIASVEARAEIVLLLAESKVAA
jgi:SpoVK/Ycf46/Vps4 family AAA+-type ATPase